MTDNNRYSLSKPYDMVGEMTAKKMAELDEMLVELYGAATKDEVRVEEIEEVIAEPAPEVSAATVFSAQIVLTHADILAANTTPRELVPAPGAGKLIRPLSISTVKNTSAGAYASNPSWSARWDGMASPDINTPASASLTVADKRFLEYVMTQINVTGITGAPFNTRIMWRGSADTTSGNAANYMVVEIVYSIITDGP